jgi:uncharacterized protein (TIGR02594 family)
MSALLYDVAQRWMGTTELSGIADNPDIIHMLTLDADWPQHDEVAWCSAAMNFWCYACCLPRTKSLLARSWLGVGQSIPLKYAVRGDVVVFARPGINQPGPLVLDAPGHVALFTKAGPEHVIVLGGNQSDTVSLASYESSRVLGVRRLKR